MSESLAPGILSPRIEKRLKGQTDLPPALPGLLNLNYSSKFYGYDILKQEAGKERCG
jgi:phosphoglycerol transferase MdoB-like AlkP superfamily enzyme